MSPALEVSELSPKDMEGALKKGDIDMDEVVSKGLWDGRAHVRRNAALAVLLQGEVPADKASLLPVAAKDSDPIVREHVVAALGSVDVDAAISMPALVRSLLDPESAVSEAALKSIEKVVERGVDGSLEYMVECLGDTRPYVQVTAVDLLVRRGKDAVEPLIGGLLHSSGLARKGSRQCLRMLGGVAADALIAALDDDALRDQIKRILDDVALSDKQVKALEKLIKGGQPVTQMVAKRLIEGNQKRLDKEQQREREKVPLLAIEGFYDGPLEDKALSGAAKGFDAVTVSRVLMDPRPVARRNAAALLGHVKADKDAVGDVVEKLGVAVRDDNAEVRALAVERLGGLGGPQAAQLAVEALNDKVPMVRDAAQEAVKGLASAEAKALVELLGGARSDAAEIALLGALADGGAKSLAALTEGLSEAVREGVRAGSARAIGMMGSGGKKAQEALIAALGDHDDGVRRQAAWALGQVAAEGDADALAALDKAVHDSVFEVRRAASMGAARLRGIEEAPAVLGEKAMPTDGFDTEIVDLAKMKKEKKLDAAELARLLFDGRPVVRANAALGLAATGKSAADYSMQLALALKDGDKRVRIAAAQALGELTLEPEQCVPALALSLRGASEELEEAVLKAIDAYGKKAVEPLVGILAGRPEVVASSVARVAKAMDGLLLGPLSDALLNAEASMVARENAADVLADLGPKAQKAEKSLLEALSEQSVLLRVKVIHAIGRVAKPTEKIAETLHAIADEDKRLSVLDAVDEALVYLRSRS